jgi:hypothetical protein
MAGEHTETETHTEGTNGAPQSRAAIHAATLAALEAGEHEGDDGTDGKTTDKPAGGKADRKPADREDDSDDDLDQDEDDDADDEDADDEDEVDADEDDDDADEGEDDEEDADDDEKKDPDLAKRMARVQKAERRSKEQLEQLKKSFEAERDAFVAEWTPKVAKAEKLQRLAAGGAHNVVEILAELGIGEDDLDLASQLTFAHSKKAASDPKEGAKYKEYAARTKREREMANELADVKKKLEEREQRETSSAEEQRQIADGMAYLEKVSRTAKKLADKYPLAAKLAAKGGKLATREFGMLAMELTGRDGVRPSRERLLRVYEKRKARELKVLELGGAAPAKSKDDAKKSGKGKDDAKKSDAKPKTLREQRAETRRLLEAGEHERELD